MTDFELLPDHTLPELPDDAPNGAVQKTSNPHMHPISTSTTDPASKLLPVGQDVQMTKHTSYMKSMHNWARKATETMRALEDQCKNVNATHHQVTAKQAQMVEQLMAENESNQKAIQHLNGLVASLIDQVQSLSEQAGTTNAGVVSNTRARNKNKSRKVANSPMERRGSSQDLKARAVSVPEESSSLPKARDDDNNHATSSIINNNNNNNNNWQGKRRNGTVFTHTTQRHSKQPRINPSPSGDPQQTI